MTDGPNSRRKNCRKLALNCSLSLMQAQAASSVCSRPPFIEISVGDGFTFFVHHRFFCVRIVSVKVDHELVISPDPGHPQCVNVTHERTRRQLKTRDLAHAIFYRQATLTSGRRTCLHCLRGTPRPPSADQRSRRRLATHDLDPSSRSYVESPRTTLFRPAQTDSLRKQRGTHVSSRLRSGTGLGNLSNCAPVSFVAIILPVRSLSKRIKSTRPSFPSLEGYWLAHTPSHSIFGTISRQERLSARRI